ncbi:MAG: DUF721 domain-containing protein [Bacteroidia bacterium]|nr:DUF721 domain-containing protein [Bacteroidia bacterium]MCO5253290.1 DUF721 domain-containing protein [Bacteroidota bacterium]MCZ2130987.1 DUF721 domain-containing protein [Bacteroidia bacterium]
MKDYRLHTGGYSIEEALEKMFSSYHIKDKVDLSKIRTYWNEIAGAVIAKYTTDLYMRKKVLYIKVSNSMLKQELNYMKANLIQSINDYFKSAVVDEIVIN